MQKLSGGNPLECGHSQVVSPFRYAANRMGYNQRPVWCVECNGWSNILPVPTVIGGIDDDDDIVDTSDDSVLEFPVDDSTVS